MNFEESIKYILNMYGIDILNDQFRARSILLDCIGNDIHGKRLVEVLTFVYKQVNVIKLFKSKGLVKGRIELTKFYPSLEKTITKREFIESINPISCFLFPEEYENIKQVHNKNNINKVVIHKKTKKIVELTKPVILINSNQILTPNYFINGLDLKFLDYSKIKGIKFIVRKTYMTLLYTSINELYCGKGLYETKYDLSKKARLVNGILEINLVHNQPYHMYAYIPKRIYDSVEIEGNNCMFSIGCQSLEPLKIDNLILNCNDCSGTVYATGKKLKIVNTNKSLNVSYSFENIDISTKNCDVDLKLDNRQFKNINVFVRAFKSRIRIAFRLWGFTRKLVSRFNQKAKLIKTFTRGKCNVKYDFEITNGYIRG